MKKIILILLLLSIRLVAYNQIIKGTIFDKETGKPINSAAIYFNGTSAGALSDEQGNFRLNVLNFKSMPLSVSALGYNTVTVPEFSADKPVIVYMKPKLFSLNEVTVNDKSHAALRKKNLRLFRDVFLGTTGTALNCEIKNEGDIRFIVSPDKDTLTAIAIKPILLDNKTLGYDITYFLEDFAFNMRDSSFLISGEIIFKNKADSLTTEKQKEYYAKKRRSAYYGSRMHFFRSLWFNEIDSTGFVISNVSKDTLGYRNLVSQSGSNSKYLKYHGKLWIAYNSFQPTSNLKFLRDSIFFDPNGYFQPHGVTWEGEMARQRIGDMLPYEYMPDQ